MNPKNYIKAACTSPNHTLGSHNSMQSYPFKKTGKLKQFHCTNKNQQNIPDMSNINKRNIMYFNTPFNIYCSTNVGKLFRDLVDKHFGRGNYLSKIFNKNTLKISYSCLPNIKSKINFHNKCLWAKEFLCKTLSNATVKNQEHVHLMETAWFKMQYIELWLAP